MGIKGPLRTSAAAEDYGTPLGSRTRHRREEPGEELGSRQGWKGLHAGPMGKTPGRNSQGIKRRKPGRNRNRKKTQGEGQGQGPRRPNRTTTPKASKKSKKVVEPEPDGDPGPQEGQETHQGHRREEERRRRTGRPRRARPLRRKEGRPQRGQRRSHEYSRSDAFEERRPVEEQEVTI